MQVSAKVTPEMPLVWYLIWRIVKECSATRSSSLKSEHCFLICNFASIVCISSQSSKCPRKQVILTPQLARQQKHGNEWTVARSKLLHRPKRDYESGKERDRERGDYGRDMGGPKAMKDRRRSKQDDRSKHRSYAYACGATTVVRLARRRSPRRSRRGTTVPLQRLGSGSKCDFHSSGLRLNCLFGAKNMLRGKDEQYRDRLKSILQVAWML